MRDAAAVQDRFLCRPLDAVCVKGTTIPVYVYELITDMVNATDRQVCRAAVACMPCTSIGVW
jgi:hypothetical protein